MITPVDVRGAVLDSNFFNDSSISFVCDEGKILAREALKDRHFLYKKGLLFGDSLVGRLSGCMFMDIDYICSLRLEYLPSHIKGHVRNREIIVEPSNKREWMSYLLNPELRGRSLLGLYLPKGYYISRESK
jgi:hypothetical protein